MAAENKEQQEKLLKLVQKIIERDDTLRHQFNVGEKFRFIRERLKALSLNIEEKLTVLQKQVEQNILELSQDELQVYVYLFNAQGNVLTSWQKILNPSVLYEHSVNRPIYAEKSNVEAYIRSRSNSQQHGYLTVIVKKNEVTKNIEAGLKDVIGHSLIKVKEGSLHFNKLISFSHHGHDYSVTKRGEIVKKA